MTTQAKEAVYGGPEYVDNICPRCGLVTKRYMAGSWDWKHIPCFGCSEQIVFDEQQQEQKPVNGELEGDD